MINYSDRFTVSGMTGTTPPNFANAVPGGTSGPADVDTLANDVQAGGGAVPAGAAGDYGIPYNKQSGSIRYAPMQPFPPTKITKKGKPTPLFPTSAFSIAKTRMPSPVVMTTMTESQTVHAMTMENTVRFLSSVQVAYSADPALLYGRGMVRPDPNQKLTSGSPGRTGIKSRRW